MCSTAIITDNTYYTDLTVIKSYDVSKGGFSIWYYSSPISVSYKRQK